LAKRTSPIRPLVMDAVQRLRRRAQLAGRLVTTPQEILRTEQEPTRIEEFITIEAPSPEVVYVPICDPSFAYGPWPYPDYPPFFPVFAGTTIAGCDWIGGPIVPQRASGCGWACPKRPSLTRLGSRHRGAGPRSGERFWGSSNRRRKAKFNPSLTLLPHRRPNDVSWESVNDCFEAS